MSDPDRDVEVDDDYFRSMKFKRYKLRDKCPECFAPMGARKLYCLYCDYERTEDEARMAGYEAMDAAAARRGKR